MTDQTQPAAAKLPEEKKNPSNGSAQGGGRNQQKRNTSRSVSTSGGNSGTARPASRGSNRKPSANTPTATESGSESATKKGNDARKNEQRGKSTGAGNGRPGGHRKGQQSSSQGQRQSSSNAGSRQPSHSKPASASPAPPVPSSENSDALSSLQRVIADLKTTSPPVQSTVTAPGLTTSISNQAQGSNLPPNAPVFQPGAAAYPGLTGAEAPRHRKAASLGNSVAQNLLNSFSPNLGSMMEDAEDGQVNTFEEGEIPDTAFQAPGHPRRSLSQSFTAPRFAALAAQQEQGDPVGPSGRPQLAPGFMFGARRRPSAAMPMGPPINEEDIGFQFPQQQNQQNFQVDNAETHRKPDGEISGIMAEQVRNSLVHTVAGLIGGWLLDRPSESDRGSATATASPLPATACF